VLDEITIDDGSTDLQIAEFVRRYPEDDVSGLTLHGDPAGQTRNSTTAESDWAMLETDPRLKPYAPKIDRGRQSPLVVDRVNATNAKFKNVNGDVGILIHPRCVDLIEDAQKTRWKDGTRILDHGSRTKGLMRTHWTDTLGYPVERIWPIVVRKALAFGALSADKPVERTEKKRGLSLGAVRV